MSELDPKKSKLIARYLAGNLSPEESKKLQEWMSRDPVNRQVVKDLEQIWEQTPEEEFNVNTADAWIHFKKNNLSKKDKSQDTPRYYQRKSSRYTFLKIAAVFLLVAITAVVSWQYFGSEPAMKEYATKQGERTEITLPDSSVVSLNVASSIRFPEEFYGANRDVYLDGEAYFEVKSSEGKPFVVHTEKAKVKVLGTKFNVQAWKEDSEAKIGVREGQVSVADTIQGTKAVVLKRGQLATMSMEQGLSVRQIDVNKLMLWMNGGMYFDKVPFDTAVRQIERKFGVQISIATPDLKNVPFTGTFQKAELMEVLDLVAASMGISYSREGNMILFEE